MQRIELEVYSTDHSAWVIRTPGRDFPALVLQGNTVDSYFTLAQSLVTRLEASPLPDPIALDEAIELRDLLRDRLLDYETVLDANAVSLPYSRSVSSR